MIPEGGLDTEVASDKVAGKKRSIEDNSANTNSFSCLANEEIIARANDMGVKMDINDFASVNLLSDLE